MTGWFVSGDRVLAIQDSEDKVLFGPLGVGVGQTARINVYGLSPGGIGGTVPLPTVPWEFTVRIFNRRGEAVHERTFAVAPGAIASFEINVGNPNDFPVDRLGRRTLRAEIVGFNPQPDPPGKFAATLEKVSVDTVESGCMTKDLALLVGPDQSWLTTEGFLDKIAENLNGAMAKA